MLVWSYTILDLFETCPRWTHYRYILKEKEAETPELREGNAVHKALEMRVSKGHILPPEYVKYEPMAASLVQARQGKKLTTELKMGVTREWMPTGFFSDDVWGRGALDVFIRGDQGGANFDWKTGKPNDKTLQLEINNVLALLCHPRLTEMVGMNIWLRNNTFSAPVRTTLNDLPRLAHNINQRVAELEEAEATNHWPEQPSGLCGWCPVKACKHNRNAR